MFPSKLVLANIDRSKYPPKSREQQLAILERFNQATADLEKRCAELGIPVPQLVC